MHDIQKEKSFNYINKWIKTHRGKSRVFMWTMAIELSWVELSRASLMIVKLFTVLQCECVETSQEQIFALFLSLPLCLYHFLSLSLSVSIPFHVYRIEMFVNGVETHASSNKNSGIIFSTYARCSLVLLHYCCIPFGFGVGILYMEIQCNFSIFSDFVHSVRMCVRLCRIKNKE